MSEKRSCEVDIRICSSFPVVPRCRSVRRMSTKGFELHKKRKRTAFQKSQIESINAAKRTGKSLETEDDTAAVPMSDSPSESAASLLESGGRLILLILTLAELNALRASHSQLQRDHQLLVERHQKLEQLEGPLLESQRRHESTNIFATTRKTRWKMQLNITAFLLFMCWSVQVPGSLSPFASPPRLTLQQQPFSWRRTD